MSCAIFLMLAFPWACVHPCVLVAEYPCERGKILRQTILALGYFCCRRKSIKAYPPLKVTESL